MGVAIDSTFFIDFSRRLPAATRKLEELEGRADSIVLPTPVIYEVLTGILRARSKTQATRFRGYVTKFQVAPLDLGAAERAAEVQTELLSLGRIKGAADILTAGIALSGGHSLVTRDKDFYYIAEATGLHIESY
ncbi:MAG: type II toxin-antitoxin system VapC family toxin [Thermoplasmata archaeon]